GTICSALGETAAAEANYRQAVAIFEGLSRDDPDNPEHRRRLARAQRDLGGMLRETSRPAEAPPLLERAGAIANALVRRHPGAPRSRRTPGPPGRWPTTSWGTCGDTRIGPTAAGTPTGRPSPLKRG